MAILKVSTACLAASLNNPDSAFGSNIYNDSGTDFAIYKGTPPTTADLNTLTTNTLAINFRVSDRLVHFTTGVRFSGDGTNPWGQLISAVTETASLTGVASWFMFWTASISRAYCTSGTISLPGQGGDLVMGDTNVISGLSYTISRIKMSVPRTYGA